MPKASVDPRRRAALGGRLCAGLALALALAPVARAEPVEPADPRPMPADLDALRREARPVLVFADSPRDPDYLGQIEAL